MRDLFRLFAILGGLLLALGALWGLSRAAAAPLPSHPSAAARPRGTLSASFTDVTTGTIPGLPQLYASRVAWGDYDQDGRLDFLIIGQDMVSGPVTRLYHNTGTGFVDASTLIPGLPQVANGSIAWGDYDNDGRLDFLLTGQATGQTKVSRLYHNTAGGFVDVSALIPGLPQVTGGSVAWGDYDNDGRLDFLLTGAVSGGFASRLYHNTANGFVDASALVPSLPQVTGSSVAWGDYDNDGLLDFLLIGDPGSAFVSRLYHNTGSGFVDASALIPGLPQLFDGSVAWGDYDNDGRLDFLLFGQDDSLNSVSKLYQNTGSGFVDAGALISAVPQLNLTSVAWGDYDNDGRLDFLLNGVDHSGVQRSALYQNTGSAFVDVTPTGLPQVDQGSVAWGDFDGDGRLDFLLTGVNDLAGSVSRLYRNTGSFTANTPPGAPSGLTATTVTSTSVTLTWRAASDPQTPAGGLSYNLRIGTRPGGADVFGPMANTHVLTLPIGLRWLPAAGPIQPLTPTRTIAGLTPDLTYYWSVQAIDSAFAGGPFAVEGSFHTPPVPLSGRPPQFIAGGPGDQQAPHVSGNFVVWEDNGDGTWDVYAKDLATGAVFPVATGPGDQRSPAVSGNLVVWQDNSAGPWAIEGAYIADDIAGWTFTISAGATDQTSPAVSGLMVVWQSAAAAGAWAVLARDVSTPGNPILTLSDGSTTNINPAIDGPLVVWQSIVPTTTLHAPAGVGRWDVLGYDLSASTPLTVSTAPGDKTNPAISGRTVVWQTYTAAGASPRGVGRWTVEGSEIDGSNHFTVTNNGDEQLHPAISGRMVVVQDRAPTAGQVPFPFTGWRVASQSLDSGDEQVLSDTSGDATMPAASGSTVVWNQTDPQGTQDVYGLPGVYLDIHAGDYFAAPVSYLSAHGAVAGYGDNTFRPFNNTTRAQLSKIVVLGFGLAVTTPPAGNYTFADLRPGYPFFDVIETAAARGLVSGYTCGGPGETCDDHNRPYFRPNANVTRGQLSKIDVLAAGWPLLNPATGTFADVDPGSAFYQVVETASCHAIVSGYTCGGPGEPCDGGHRPYFRPNNSAIRGQIAKIVYLSILDTNSATCPAAAPR